ncbi:hypothetical protein HPP92_008202 [Vanilla planifolia]|uniref:Endonuclease/exonuclease/phosphatase domain-containing protein n=1 Tax=Vanilla planifolia TaxID=51239 RepID=A0A835RH89_VANPL|nr:hypothetical protein HPP92_008202 [Vanilla planifolia]
MSSYWVFLSFQSTYMTKLVVWNVRGIRDQKSRCYLQRFTREANIGVVALVETRVETFDRRDVDTLLGREWSFVAQPVEGKSGGIVILWRQEVVLSITRLSTHVVVMEVGLSCDIHIRCCVVYSPKDAYHRRGIWQILREESTQDSPMMVLGDFNIVLSQEEKKGGKPFTFGLGQQEFHDVMQELSLVDLGFVGNRYTWCNGRKGSARIWERLDRVLINSKGLCSHPSLSVAHLACIGSDHCPLVVSVGNRSTLLVIPRYRFENVWLDNPNSAGIVRDVWKRKANGDRMTSLTIKFHRCMVALHRLSKRDMGNIARTNIDRERLITKMQNKESNGGLIEDKHCYLGNLITEFNRGCALEEKWWWQRAKLHWATLGDRNSRFFHAAATSRWRNNLITKLINEDGSELDASGLIGEALMQYFGAKWGSDLDALPSVRHMSHACISLEQHSSLVRDVSTEEILAAIRSCKRNKVPGVDETTSEFIVGSLISCVRISSGAVSCFLVTVGCHVLGRTPWWSLSQKDRGLAKLNISDPLACAISYTRLWQGSW